MACGLSRTHAEGEAEWVEEALWGRASASDSAVADFTSRYRGMPQEQEDPAYGAGLAPEASATNWFTISNILV